MQESTGRIRDFEAGTSMPPGWIEVTPGAEVNLHGQRLILCRLKGDRFIFRHHKSPPTVKEQKFEAQEIVRKPVPEQGMKEAMQEYQSKASDLLDKMSGEKT